MWHSLLFRDHHVDAPIDPCVKQAKDPRHWQTMLASRDDSQAAGMPSQKLKRMESSIMGVQNFLKYLVLTMTLNILSPSPSLAANNQDRITCQAPDPRNDDIDSQDCHAAAQLFSSIIDNEDDITLHQYAVVTHSADDLFAPTVFWHGTCAFTAFIKVGEVEVQKSTLVDSASNLIDECVDSGTSGGGNVTIGAYGYEVKVWISGRYTTVDRADKEAWVIFPNGYP
ncbi:uncharacterized protein KY384_007972 [Bacidia gigantensis]|uniref:uncharacterized protein n=1 Tax=Bacidia gigantensis TaxID=2732470 RepID=UPI001D0588C0|nr:uncharacterized protein KY384_007972 [Bacidia gigantensis]KAG8527818.1 hypothetical protein KY384_007972 [Bacidia gigantensis]